jgi:hypothetical protein
MYSNIYLGKRYSIDDKESSAIEGISESGAVRA